MPTSSSRSLQRPRVPPTYALPSQTAFRYYLSTGHPRRQQRISETATAPRKAFPVPKSAGVPSCLQRFQCLRASVAAPVPAPLRHAPRESCIAACATYSAQSDEGCRASSPPPRCVLSFTPSLPLCLSMLSSSYLLPCPARIPIPSEIFQGAASPVGPEQPLHSWPP